MPKWDSGTNDCEEQDLIMQAGAPRQARHVRLMRSRLQGATCTSHLRRDLHSTAFCRGQGCAQSQCKSGRGEPIQSRRKCGRGTPTDLGEAPGVSHVSVRMWDG